MPKHPPYRRAALRTRKQMTNTADHLSLKKGVHGEWERKVYPETEQPQKRKRQSRNLFGYFHLLFKPAICWDSSVPPVHTHAPRAAERLIFLLFDPLENHTEHPETVTHTAISVNKVCHSCYPSSSQRGNCLSFQQWFCNSYYIYLYLKTKIINIRHDALNPATTEVSYAQVFPMYHLRLHIEHNLEETETCCRSAVEGRSLRVSLAISGKKHFKGSWDPQQGRIKLHVGRLLLASGCWSRSLKAKVMRDDGGRQKNWENVQKNWENVGHHQWWTGDAVLLEAQGSLEKDHCDPHVHSQKLHW